MFTLTSKLDKKQIELIQLTKMNTIKNYKGSSSPIAGWQSLEFNKKLPITQLQFTNNNQKMLTISLSLTQIPQTG